MKTASRILIIYLLLLLAFSLLLNGAGIYNFIWNIGMLKIPVNFMTLLTVIGGIIALKYTVSINSFKVFLKIYGCLWILEYIVIYTGNQIGEVFMWNRIFKFNEILKYHYQNYSRLSTPLPFITFWFVNYIFSKPTINAESNTEINKN